MKAETTAGVLVNYMCKYELFETVLSDTETNLELVWEYLRLNSLYLFSFLNFIICFQ